MMTMTLNTLKTGKTNSSNTVKLAVTYAAAHLTALSTVGILYLLGLFDVGFLSRESLGVQLANAVLTKIL